MGGEEFRVLVDESTGPTTCAVFPARRGDSLEASEHDRDTVRDEIEGLAFEAEGEY